MLGFIYRKIINNKWLFLCLFIGALSTGGILSSIPLYSNGVLQRMLTRDLENSYLERNVSPGAFSVELTRMGVTDRALINQIKDITSHQLYTGYRLPVQESLQSFRLNQLNLFREGDEFFNEQRRKAVPVWLSEVEKHISLVHGRMPNQNASEDVFEVIVSQEAFNNLQLIQDETYSLSLVDFVRNERTPVIEIQVVGIFSVKDMNALYWSGGRYRSLQEVILFSEEQLNTLLDRNSQLNITRLECVYFMDFHSVSMADVESIIQTFEEQQRWNDRNRNLVKITLPMMKVLEEYQQRKVHLQINLWILTIPMMLIVCFYTLMVSGLIVHSSRNEIAVLKSRGAGRLQVFLLYTAESLVLAAVTFLAGPSIGFMICRFMGASNGFLEFIGRRALPLVITREVYLYAFLAAFLFTLFMIVPVIKASTTGIVQYKRSLLNGSQKPFWQRFYLDIVVLALCYYGNYSFQNRQNILGMTHLSGTELGVDPLLFFISTFFILGMSLLILRVYPVFIRLLFRVGNRWWNSVAYFSLANVSRCDKNQQSIMLFIILALSFGIMNANQARTMNSNTVDRAMYNRGADVVIVPHNNLINSQSSFEPVGMQALAYSSLVKADYREPPYDQYKKIQGVDSITRVLVDNRATLTGGETIRNLRLMGITPHEFAQTAWFRGDLLPHHINDYMNMLTHAPTAVLLSGTIRDNYRIRAGDTIFIRFSEGDSLEFTVYGFIDYFPTCNPYTEDSLNLSHFAVVNHSYIMKKLSPRPYEIWIKKQQGVTDGSINAQLDALSLMVERVDYTSQEVIQKKNDPILLGTNGVLTMCFIITMLIAGIGYVIFWVLSIREKSLKFGIFRAMGMPMRNITMIIILEQLLVSVVAILIGVALGTAASTLFIPMLEMVYSAYEQIPPFKVVAYKRDYINVLGIASGMLLTGLTFLFGLVRSINVHQVLKMGED